MCFGWKLIKNVAGVPWVKKNDAKGGNVICEWKKSKEKCVTVKPYKNRS